ncbi:uncharacterized protein [Henckelia pumila]|uniref:uncharacterized protein n=1 Tax=Henckelia pumila TaxID=405737 RepID=UPI003C6DF00A
MVDAASGEVFVYKTPVQARNLIERNGQNMKVCGIYTARGHATDMCPTLQEGSAEQVNATGGFLGPPQRKYDPYSNTYNLGWKDHPNPRYGNPQAIQAPPHNPVYRPPKLEQVSKLEALNSNSLPSQTVLNPRENVSAITLRSGKELKVNEEVVKEPVQNKDEQESKVEEDDTIQEAPRGKFPPLSEYKPVAPFPLALKESRKDEGIKGLYEVFCRCERKQKLKGCQKVELGEQVSAVIQKKVPTKCKDPGMFSIPCKIGDVQLDTAILDLGASINVMPYSVYASLKLGSLTETGIVIQMADKSTIFPRGVLEDVLVQVDNLVFPANFYAPKKSKKKKQRPKISTKLRKNPMPQPPQSKFQYDSSVMLSDVEEDSANT